MKVRLIPLVEEDKEKFIKDNQYAFKYGAMEESGLRDIHLLLGTLVLYFFLI